MKYFIIAGEASGDLHASNLMKELKILDKKADFRFFGGDLMKKEGGEMIMHYRNLAFMGILPVILHLPDILKNMRLCKESIASFHPDVVILVDYPGFNLRIAKYVHTCLNIPVYYYISPKVWAWKKWRIKEFRRYVNKMFCILPFEVNFYKHNNYQVDYVGNPTVDEYYFREDKDEKFSDFVEKNHLDGRPIIAILAGSREQEIKDNLPVMLEVVEEFRNYQAVIAGAPGIDATYYKRYMKNFEIPLVFNCTFRLLQQSKAALVTSGTATLETALFHVPQVVCYKTPVGRLISFIFEKFFTVKYISLVNLIADKTVVKELFGEYFSRENIFNELKRILEDKKYRSKMISEYDHIVELLGHPGASARTAKLIVSGLQYR